MIMDKYLEFCDGVDVSGAAGTALEGSQIDLGTARDIGQFSDLYLVINVTTSFASGGASTIQFELASDATAAVATDGSATTHVLTEAFAYTALTAGTRLVFRLPVEGNAYEQFLGLLVRTAAATSTAGTIDAFLTHDANGRWKASANAVN